MKRLHSLDPAETSLVKAGANKRKFLVLKSQGGDMKVDKEPVQKSAKAEAALKAATRILAPFKDEIAKEDLDEVIGAELADGEDQEDVEKDADKEPSKKKLTKKKPPADEEDIIEGDEPNDTPVNKKKVKKAAAEADDEDLDLSDVPEKVRSNVENVFKSNKELIAKTEKLEKDLATERKARREKEFVAKCDEFKHYTGDKKELAGHLMELEEKSPRLYESFVKQLEGIETERATVAKSLFSETGSSQPGSGTGWEAIEKQALSRVAKSTEKVSKETAIDQFLETDEGKRMYSEYRASRKDGV